MQKRSFHEFGVSEMCRIKVTRFIFRTRKLAIHLPILFTVHQLNLHRNPLIRSSGEFWHASKLIEKNKRPTDTKEQLENALKTMTVLLERFIWYISRHLGSNEMCISHTIYIMSMHVQVMYYSEHFPMPSRTWQDRIYFRLLLKFFGSRGSNYTEMWEKKCESVRTA